MQYLAVRYTERLDEAGAVASVGSRGDYDKAMAEAFNSLFKAELVRNLDPATASEPQPTRITNWNCGDGVTGTAKVPASCPSKPLRLGSSSRTVEMAATWTRLTTRATWRTPGSTVPWVPGQPPCRRALAEPELPLEDQWFAQRRTFVLRRGL